MEKRLNEIMVEYICVNFSSRLNRAHEIRQFFYSFPVFIISSVDFYWARSVEIDAVFNSAECWRSDGFSFTFHFYVISVSVFIVMYQEFFTTLKQ
ncbi:acetyltransferase [Xenorhabdus sp. PB62.4]|nr:acetyltransferase [Xenorhabdus sp. PB62.4]